MSTPTRAPLDGGNHDLHPIPKKERTYGWMGLFAYWATCGVSVSNFTIGSAYIAYGLDAGETIGAVLLRAIIAAANACFCARPGQDQYLGYSLGCFDPYTVVLLGGIVFCGIQAYFGGQAVTIIFFVPPHQIRKFLYPSFIIITVTFFGILGWAVHTNHGTGPLVASGLKITAAIKTFRIIQCVSSVGGSWSGAAERISDWTRFSRSKNAAVPGILFALPITVTLTG